MEDALFKYNKLSLSHYPHFWFVEGGWQYIDHAGQEPAPGGEHRSRTTPRTWRRWPTPASASVRSSKATPRRPSATRTARSWNTDFDRINEWMADPTDIEYFPLRGDLLERRHQFYGDFRHDISGLLYYGAYGRYELARIGSSLWPSPDPAGAAQGAADLRTRSCVIPWIGASYAGNMRTLFYLYLRKELNQDDARLLEQDVRRLGSATAAKPVVSFGYQPPRWTSRNTT